MINKNVILSKLDRNEIYRYLGYKGNTPDKVVRGIIDEYEVKLLKTIKPAYIFRLFDIKEDVRFDEYKGIEFIGTDLKLQGNSIRKHLMGCNQAVLISATISAGADKLIRQTEINDMAKAFIVDTLASVAVEQLCDIVEMHISERYKDKHLTFRFGVGYGDLPLYHEKMILDILNAGKLIGLCSSETNILTPRKSVVCVIGLSDKPMPKGQRGCLTCNMSKHCNYRRQGLNCGY